MAIFRVIQPAPSVSSFKEEYEYLLSWISPSGGISQWYFSHTEGGEEVSFKSEVIDTTTDFRGVPNEEDIKIEINSMSLNREEFEFVATIFKSNRIERVFKDGSTKPVAIAKSKKKKPRNIKDFSISFTIMEQEPDLMNV